MTNLIDKNKISDFIKDTIAARSKNFICALVILSALFVAYLDFVTKVEISLFLFYVFPVSLSAWALGRWQGVIVSVFCVVLAQVTDYYSGTISNYSLVSILNIITRFSFFLIVTILLSRLYKSLLSEKTLSMTDYLTGALNSRAFYAAATRELIRSKRFGRPITFVYFDLDNFKDVNDNFGHSAGNALLKDITRIVKLNLRSIDVFARLGGDEFAMLLVETDAVMAEKYISRIRNILLLDMAKKELSVTLSIGVLTCFALEESLDNIIKYVDSLMYEVKNSGKNSVKYATCKDLQKLKEKNISGTITL